MTAALQLRILDRKISELKARLVYLVEQKAYLQAELVGRHE